MRKTWRRVASVSAIVAASCVEMGPAAQENAAGNACAQLLPAIEDLKAMLADDSKARLAENETQRMQLLMSLLGLRYHNIEVLEASLRNIVTQEDEIRGAFRKRTGAARCD